MNETIKIHTDGGSRGNPGNSACAFLIENGDQKIEKYFYLGIMTNNQAEYLGVLKAYEELVTIFSSTNEVTLEFFLDSELVVKQLTGVYKIKNQSLLEISQKVKSFENKFLKISYKHVPREENKEADKLVNICLDENRN